MKTHQKTREKVECPQPGCSKSFYDKWNLKKHFNDFHPNESLSLTNIKWNPVITKVKDGYPTCDICQKSFERLENLKSHMKSHHCSNQKATINCNHCENTFCSKSNWVKHMRRHTAEADARKANKQSQSSQQCGETNSPLAKRKSKSKNLVQKPLRISTEQWPSSLHKYVALCFEKCTSRFESDQMDIYLKRRINEAKRSGEFLAINWETEPVPSTLLANANGKRLTVAKYTSNTLAKTVRNKKSNLRNMKKLPEAKSSNNEETTSPSSNIVRYFEDDIDLQSNQYRGSNPWILWI